MLLKSTPFSSYVLHSSTRHGTMVFYNSHTCMLGLHCMLMAHPAPVLPPPLLCMQALSCTSTADAPACVVGNMVLQPGQAAPGLVFAVSEASTLCAPYSYTAQRACLPNNTLSAGPFYDSCITVIPPRDSSNCAVPVGYTFLPNQAFKIANEGVFDDETPWIMLPSSARAEAATDAQLMSARCDQTADCAAFDVQGSANLRSHVPIPSRIALISNSTNTSTLCQGMFTKQMQLSSCPRVPGYVFVPGRSWAQPTSSGPVLSDAVCTQCESAPDLAALCSADPTCAAFSNLNGLLANISSAAAAVILATTARFTSTPCKVRF